MSSVRDFETLPENSKLITKVSKINRLKIIFKGKLVVEADTDIGYLLLPRISGQILNLTLNQTRTINLTFNLNLTQNCTL